MFKSRYHFLQSKKLFVIMPGSSLQSCCQSDNPSSHGCHFRASTRWVGSAWSNVSQYLATSTRTYQNVKLQVEPHSISAQNWPCGWGSRAFQVTSGLEPRKGCHHIEMVSTTWRRWWWYYKNTISPVMKPSPGINAESIYLKTCELEPTPWMEVLQAQWKPARG